MDLFRIDILCISTIVIRLLSHDQMLVTMWNTGRLGYHTNMVNDTRLDRSTAHGNMTLMRIDDIS